jgi:hypothetical protein
MRHHAPRRGFRACFLIVTVLAAVLVQFDSALAQGRGGQQPPRPRVLPFVYLSAWGGGFTDVGGFAETDLDAFFNFGKAVAYGGGLHFRAGQGLVVGVEGSYARPEYERHERVGGDLLTSGEAKVASALLSARLTSPGAGAFSLYLTGGAGVFAYSVPEPDLEEWDKDFALSGGAGIDYRFASRLGLFLEYGRMWAYHQKGNAERNTANHSLVRLGTRLGI